MQGQCTFQKPQLSCFVLGGGSNGSHPQAWGPLCPPTPNQAGLWTPKFKICLSLFLEKTTYFFQEMVCGSVNNHLQPPPEVRCQARE